VNRKTPRQLIPTAPSEYKKEYLDLVVRAVNLFVGDAVNPGDMVGSSLQLINPPGSGYGLKPGSVFVDGDGFLKMVRLGDVYAPTNLIRVKLGSVTVSIT
jgi:hypothetical protein